MPSASEHDGAGEVPPGERVVEEPWRVPEKKPPRQIVKISKNDPDRIQIF
jgi:hypothetical protein